MLLLSSGTIRSAVGIPFNKWVAVAFDSRVLENLLVTQLE
jgi:hypothetical protein